MNLFPFAQGALIGIAVWVGMQLETTMQMFVAIVIIAAVSGLLSALKDRMTDRKTNG